MANEESTPPTHKTCKKCGEIKPVDAFRLAATQRDPHARRNQCLPCEYAQSKTSKDLRRPAIRRYNQAYYEATKDQRRPRKLAYNADNRLKKAHLESKRKARLRLLPSTFTEEQAHFCRQYFHYACAICEREESFVFTLAMDHWIPLQSADCPGTIATNMIPLCHGTGGCNNRKRECQPHAWLLECFGPRKGATILRKINAYFDAVRLRFPSTDSGQPTAR